MKHPLTTSLLCAATALIFSGCVGHPIWKDRVHAPAPDPKVELRLQPDGPRDVLVVYDEQDPDTLKMTRRSYFLFTNLDWMKDGGVPKFVSMRLGPRWEKIPIYAAPVKTLSDIHGDIFAVAEGPRHFVLYSHGDVADFKLPEYRDMRIAKTLVLAPVIIPLAAAALGADAALSEDSSGAAQTAQNPPRKKKVPGSPIAVSNPPSVH